MDSFPHAARAAFDFSTPAVFSSPAFFATSSSSTLANGSVFSAHLAIPSASTTTAYSPGSSLSEYGSRAARKTLSTANMRRCALPRVPGPAATTHVSAAAGLVTWALVETWRDAKPTSLGMATGAVAGLVGVTPGAGFVNPGAAMAIGAITAVLCYASVRLKKRLRFDDSLDTFAVHGVGGTVGALLTGVFASAPLIASHPAGAVLAENGRFALILGQLQAVLVAYGLAAAGTLVIALALRQLGVPFRVSDEAERLGVDIQEHGEEAYAERAGSPIFD